MLLTHTFLVQDSKNRDLKYDINRLKPRDIQRQDKIFLSVYSTLILFLMLLWLSVSGDLRHLIQHGSEVDVLTVNYVWIENRRTNYPRDLTALQYLSILSAIQNLPSFKILVHTNANFSGPLWSSVRKKVNKRGIERRRVVNGKEIGHIQQEADLIKVDLVYKFGGLFVDFDIYFTGNTGKFLRSWRNADCVFSTFIRENRTFFAVGNFACRPQSTFIQKIIEEYENNFRGYACYSDSNAIPYLYNGCLFPYNLYKLSPEFQRSVKLEPELLHIPNKRFDFLNQNGRIDWKSRFNIHSGYEGKDLTLHQIFRLNSSYGDMLRWIYNKSEYSIRKSSAEICDISSQDSDWGFQYLKLNFPNGFQDLSVLEYISVYSCLRNAKPMRISIYSPVNINGPLWGALLDESTSRNIVLENIICDVNQIRKSIKITEFDEYFLRKPGIHDFPLKLPKTGFSDPDVINWKNPSVAVIKAEYGFRDFSFELIRKMSNSFGQLLRFVFFGKTDVVRDFKFHKFKCS